MGEGSSHITGCLGGISDIGSVTGLTPCLAPRKEVCKRSTCLLRGLVATERAGPNLVEVFLRLPDWKRKCFGDAPGAQSTFWAAYRGSQPRLELRKGPGYPGPPPQLRMPHESPCRGSEH